MSKNYGQSWFQLADFHSLDKRNTTTGQPFITSDGTILVPTWNSSFYTHGTLWFAIYKGNKHGSSWLKVYEDLGGTYGKHFFESPTGDLYIGVGIGGGGTKGRISSRPNKSYLLKSEDMGKTWKKILRVSYSTSLYSGVALNDETVLVTAREKKSLFLSRNSGETWSEIHVGNVTRSASYVEELHKIVVTSNSAIFTSNDALHWTRLNAPIKGLILRYPTFYKGKLYMSHAGWHGYIVSTDLSKWYLSYDVTKETGSNLGARMVILNDYVFVGDESNGTLIRIGLPLNNNNPINMLQILEGNMNFLAFLAKYLLKSLIGYARTQTYFDLEPIP